MISKPITSDKLLVFNRRLRIAYLLIFFTFIFTYVQAFQRYIDQKNACERGNGIRQPVYQNTLAAIKENEDRSLERIYQRNLDFIIEASPTLNKDTGVIDCNKVINKPWPL